MAATLDGNEQVMVHGLCCELCTTYTVRGRMWGIHPPRGGSIIWICTACRERVLTAQPINVEDPA